MECPQCRKCELKEDGDDMFCSGCGFRGLKEIAESLQEEMEAEAPKPEPKPEPAPAPEPAPEPEAPKEEPELKAEE